MSLGQPCRIADRSTASLDTLGEGGRRGEEKAFGLGCSIGRVSPEMVYCMLTRHAFGSVGVED